MNTVPLSLLLLAVALLVALSAFLSASGTGLLTMSRQRLTQRVRAGEPRARLAHGLLQQPDHLVGLLLFGRTLCYVLAAALSAALGLRIGDELGVVIAAALLTIVILAIAEVVPKTLAVLYPERIALPAAPLLWLLMRLFQPAVWAVNQVGRLVLRLFGITPEDSARLSLSSDELRSVVAEAGALIPQRHQALLLSILDLEQSTVEDIMIPRNEIIGIDMNEPEARIQTLIIETPHTRLPLYRGSIDDLVGTVHVRNALKMAREGTLTAEHLAELAHDPYFVLEGTPLNQQLLNFQTQKRRLGFVVDEYGDIQGLVTLADILGEIIGEFTADPMTRIKNVFRDNDGSYIVHGSVSIRGLNRSLGWKLPTAGPKTVNGLILESMEAIPKPGDRLQLRGYSIEITEIRANAVKTARMRAMVG